MRATGVPNPFFAPTGFDIEVVGGKPPYTYVPEPAPPNPPGVEVSPDGHVSVPPGTPPGTEVRVRVTDASTPPRTAVAGARVQ